MMPTHAPPTADRGQKHVPDEDSARPGTSERAAGAPRAHAISRHVPGAACEQGADGWLCARCTDGEAEAWRESREAGPGSRSPSLCREIGSELPVQAPLPVSGHTEGLHGVGARAPAAQPPGRWVSWPAPWRLGLLSWVLGGGALPWCPHPELWG